jgi:hypothetical protein
LSRRTSYGCGRLRQWFVGVAHGDRIKIPYRVCGIHDVICGLGIMEWEKRLNWYFCSKQSKAIFTEPHCYFPLSYTIIIAISNQMGMILLRYRISHPRQEDLHSCKLFQIFQGRFYFPILPLVIKCTTTTKIGVDRHIDWSFLMYKVCSMKKCTKFKLSFN